MTRNSAVSAGETWRLLPYDVGPSDRHFALSSALVRDATMPTVWAHSTAQPTLILGASQHDRAIDEEAIRSLGVRVVRRQAGGTSVYAGPGVLGVDVVVPAAHALALADVVESYRWIGEIWTEVMRSLCVAARTVTIEEARNAGTGDLDVEAAVGMACFGSLSPYEIVVDNRKLVGLAQVRRRNAALWQSGVNTSFEYDALAVLLAPTRAPEVARELRARAIGLDEVMTEPPQLQTLAKVFADTLSRILGVTLKPGDWTQEELTPISGSH